MGKGWRYFLFLLWLSYLLSCGVLLFTKGFLLSRQTLENKSSCVENVDCSSHQKRSEDDPSLMNKRLYLDCLDKDQLKLRKSPELCVKSEKRVIFIIIDALKYDFARYNHSVDDDERLPFQNRLPIMEELLTTVPNNTHLFKFIANPPTTTMQRLKGLTTGSLPTFIDVGSNFATPEIDEDNIIDQLLSQGKKAVFMGDDTWMALYPKRFMRRYPYPSFNMWDLDTVDKGILKHLKPEIQEKDWDLLIAHFLGVDHCGHTYGPNHKEMSRKLSEMNEVIRDIVDTMDDNTMLFVAGDHGMTPTGDHGGESEDEVTAALFVYSPQPFLTSSIVTKSDSVYQVDLVPTLSTILGFAIPFSNLGRVILETLPIPTDTQYSDLIDYALEPLLINIEQMMLYINTYSRHSNVFTKEKIQSISQKFYGLKKKLESVDNTITFREFQVSSIEFLNFVRTLCEEVWVQFDSFSISRGLVLTFLLLSFSFFIVEGVPGDHLMNVLEGSFLWFAYGIAMCSALFSGTLGYYRIIDDPYLLMYVSTLTMSIFCMAIVVVHNWEEITSLWYNSGKSRDWLDLFAKVVHLCCLLSVFSNSFVVEEATVLSFLINSIVCLIAFSINPYKVEPPPFLAKTRLYRSPWVSKIINMPKFRSVALALAFMVLMRSSHSFWRCREEQKWCMVEASESQQKVKADGTNIDMIVTLAVVALFTSVCRMWLRSCGNLVGFSPTVTFARYGPSVVVVCMGGFWVLHKLPKETRSRLFLPGQLQPLPWIVFALLAFGLACLFIQPVCVYVLGRRGDILSVYGQQNIIPQLFHQVKEVMKKSEGGRENDRGASKSDMPVVYGLATVYSSVLVILTELVSLLVIILLGDTLASSVVSMVAIMFILLTILSFTRLENTLVTVQLFQVPWLFVLCWGILSCYFFYGTGHQPTFPGIQWYAAFVGTGGQFTNTFIPSILVGLNTFCSQLLYGLTLPLLLVAPFTLYTMHPSWLPLTPRPKDDLLKETARDELKQGELHLFEMEGLTQYALFKVCAKYMLFHGTRVFSCMLAAAVHCRHLMVWMIFAPRFIFEAIGFFVTLGATLVGYMLMLRVSHQVDQVVADIVTNRS